MFHLSGRGSTHSVSLRTTGSTTSPRLSYTHHHRGPYDENPRPFKYETKGYNTSGGGTTLPERLRVTYSVTYPNPRSSYRCRSLGRPGCYDVRRPTYTLWNYPGTLYPYVFYYLTAHPTSCRNQGETFTKTRSRRTQDTLPGSYLRERPCYVRVSEVRRGVLSDSQILPSPLKDINPYVYRYYSYI